MKSIARLQILIIAFAAASSSFAQSVDDSIRSLSGKDFIFLGHNRDKVVNLSAADLDQRKEGCVVAVTVLAASYSENRWQFDLRAFGTPGKSQDSGLPSPKACSDSSFDSKLVITGDGSNGRESVLRSILNNVLVSPEIYLARHGKVIEYREPDEAESAVAIRPSKEIQTKLLLAVEPFYIKDSSTVRIDDSIEVNVVVGTHGRIQSPQIVKSLDAETDARVIRVLALWRLEPARNSGKPVPVRFMIIIRFRTR